MREDFASIHPQNLAEFAQHLQSIGAGLEYDPQEHLKAWKSLQASGSGLADVSGMALSEVLGSDSPVLDEAAGVVRRQVKRWRLNLGASGPPGRAD
jgi:hypothetical protein